MEPLSFRILAGLIILTIFLFFIFILKIKASKSNLYDDYFFTSGSSKQRIDQFSFKVYKKIKRVCGRNCRVIINAIIPKQDGHFIQIDQLVITPKGLLPVMTVIPAVKKKDRIRIKGKFSEDKWSMEILSKGKQKVLIKTTSFAVISERIVQALIEYLSALYEESRLTEESLKVLTPIFILPKNSRIYIEGICCQPFLWTKMKNFKRVYGKKELIGDKEESNLSQIYEALEELYLS